MRRRAAGLALAAVIGLLAVSGAVAAPPGKPHAWFDAPLPGATLPLATYQVVVHAADESGVAKVRFQVDGTPAATQAPSGPGDLVVVSWSWTPASEGAHMITAVAEGIDGSLSDPVAVGVIVDADAGALPTPDISPGESASGEPTATPLASGATPGPTATSGPTATPRPTPVPTPVPTPCAPAGPTLTKPYLYEQITTNPPTLEWNPGEQDCVADHFHIVVSTESDLSRPLLDTVVANDTTFYTLPDPLAGSLDCVYYYWTVYAVDADGNEYLAETSAFLVCTRA
jgi:hypothetical protein